MPHPLPTQDDLRGNADPLLVVLAERILDFRAQHLHEGSDYLDVVTNGQKPLAIVSQCIDGRQPVHTITGLPLGRLIAQSSIAGYLNDYPESPSAWASILFAVKSLGAPVIIKLGHTVCGGADKLVEICLNQPEAILNNQVVLDPTLEWLRSAIPLAMQVRQNNPGLSHDDLAYALEEELVRDGVRKLENFVERMLREGHITLPQRPVVVGLLFDMRAAKLLHLTDSGEFRLLSQTKADLIDHHGDCCAHKKSADGSFHPR